MKLIVLIEDDPCDAEAILKLLSPAIQQEDVSIERLSTLESAELYFRNHHPDLVLLDLEFTNEKTTSIYLLQDILVNVPVIVVSHLSHYQKQISQQIDVRAFIRKDAMSQYLLHSVERVLFPTQHYEIKRINFPSPTIHSLSESMLIRDISYIEKTGRTTYEVYTVSGKIVLIRSVYFADLCDELKKQHITLLQPVSRNQIINTACIKTISRTPKGRIFIELINYPDKQFNVGKGYERYFVETFLSN